MNRDCVRIFSTKSRLGIRSFWPPNGARSTFRNPFRSRTFRLAQCRASRKHTHRREKGCFYHTAFIMRRLMV